MAQSWRHFESSSDFCWGFCGNSGRAYRDLERMIMMVRVYEKWFYSKHILKIDNRLADELGVRYMRKN
jgi:hypothetical protein